MARGSWRPTPFNRRWMVQPGGRFSDFRPKKGGYSSGTVPVLHRTCPFKPLRVGATAPPGEREMPVSLASIADSSAYVGGPAIRSPAMSVDTALDICCAAVYCSCVTKEDP